MNPNHAHRIYDVLVEMAGADESGRMDFVMHMVNWLDGSLLEYRFIGALGFGGKFRYDPHSDRFYVDQYREDETKTSKALIVAINKRLASL